MEIGPSSFGHRGPRRAEQIEYAATQISTPASADYAAQAMDWPSVHLIIAWTLVAQQCSQLVAAGGAGFGHRPIDVSVDGTHG